MKALIWDGSMAAVGDRDEPRAEAGMAVVRVHRAGVCNTDLEIVRGYMGFEGVLGHELVGEVLAGPNEWLGARVVCEINFACGRCATCAQELGRHCPERRVMGILGADGAFAERVAVPVANLHRVPDGIDDDAAVFCEPLAAAFEILEQIDLRAGQQCIVLGDGKLGLLVAQVLAGSGAAVLAVGKHPTKLAHLEARGIGTCALERFDPDRPTARGRADLVVDATGSAGALELAMRATRPRGTLVLKSTVAERAAVDLAPLVIDEISVVGSRCGPFAPALRALEAGSIDVAPLITERYALARAAEALEHAGRRGAQKILIDCL